MEQQSTIDTGTGTERVERKKKLKKRKSRTRAVHQKKDSLEALPVSNMPSSEEQGMKPTVNAWWALTDDDNKPENEVASILLKLITKQPQYAVPRAPVQVKETTGAYGLNKLITLFLEKAGMVEEIPLFEFMISGKLLAHSIGKHLTEIGKSFEQTIEVQYFERHPPPTPKDNLEHDDWVSSVMSCGDWLLTGCYDNTVQLWSVDENSKGLGKRAHKLTIPAHHAPVKAVSWINTNKGNNKKLFVSCSIDQTAIVWEWNSANNSVDCIWECRGHTQSVECVAVESEGTKFVTGSWDNTIKIWDSDTSQDTPVQTSNSEPDAKKVKSKTTKTPLMTLGGHSECVSSLNWVNSNQIISSSWDHTLRLWDIEIGGKISQIHGNVAFFSTSYCPKSRLILGCCADRHIRLYDIRAKDGSIVLNKYTSHTKWVSSVSWSAQDENLFVSGSYDHITRVWDKRRAKMSIYTMEGHRDKVLAVDWSHPSHIASGSTDCTAQIYSVDK